MKQDDLINTLFHSRDPLEGLDKVHERTSRIQFHGGLL